MRKWRLLFLSFYSTGLFAQQGVAVLPIYPGDGMQTFGQDWLLHPVSSKAAVYRSADSGMIILSNGLLKRVFCLQPALACIDFKNLQSGEQMIRSIKPEASVVINDQPYDIGGLSGQKENAYFRPEWLAGMKKGSEDFRFESFEISRLKPLLYWKDINKAVGKQTNSGVEIAFHYQGAIPALEGLKLTVHYVLYDGLPLMSKWVSLQHSGKQKIKINRLVNEILATPEEESAVVGETGQMKIPHGIYVESNYAFNNAMRYDLSDQTTHWLADSGYTSQVNYNFKTPCLLKVYVEKGPGIELKQRASFESIHTFELLLDSYDRERRGLCIRSMYNAIAPWTKQDPIFMHLVSRNDDEVREAIDQCAQTGYEALILSFGSHCDMEDTTAENIRHWKTLATYAHQKHILIGSYSLFSSRKISDEDDVIDPLTGKPDAGAFFGNAPCYGSKWGLAYLEKLKFFISQTGFDLFENDGPYPGDLCASTHHPGHIGLDDSQWRQMELQKSLYHWCSENGVYVNAPDWYFLDGTNKIALGYREVNFSLPREQQLILNRQNIFDGTWEKTGSMSWGFVPLTKYQGGGPEAVLEPLSEHLKDYIQLMIQYYGAGVQACYRGTRLYDNQKTMQAVTEMIGWYKKYRQILNSNIIHLRRADGRDWDGWMHADPAGKIKGMLFLFNPLKTSITRTIDLPLYYTGLSGQAMIGEKERVAKVYQLARNYSVKLTCTIGPESYTWFTVQ